MKKIFNVIVLCIGIFICTSNTTAYADEKQYDIENARFDVVLSEDGSAYVTEKFDINFKKGDFTRFNLSRLKAPNDMERYDVVNVNSFKINGKECSYTDDLENRPEGTYSIVDNGEKVEYSWYFRANNSRVTLENSYVVPRLTKANENGYAFFCYRFLGVDFKKEINNIEINIKAPRSSNMEVRNDSKMKYTVNEDSVTLRDTNRSGIIKINVAMDKNIFSPSINTISQEALHFGDENEDKGEGIVVGAFLAAALCTASAFLFASNKRNKLAKDEKYINDILNELKVDNVTPFELSKIYGLNTTYVNQFKLIFLELVRRGIFNISEDKIYIYDSSIDDLKGFEVQCVEALNKFAKRDDSDKKYITMYELLLILNDTDTLADIVEDYDSREIFNFKEKYKGKIKVLKKYFNSYAKGYSSEMGEIISKYKEYNFIELENLYYMAGKELSTSQKENDYYDEMREEDCYYNDAFAFMEYHSYNYIDNSTNHTTNGTSCSSCSSCSSCGGGGAD